MWQVGTGRPGGAAACRRDHSRPLSVLPSGTALHEGSPLRPRHCMRRFERCRARGVPMHRFAQPLSPPFCCPPASLQLRCGPNGLWLERQHLLKSSCEGFCADHLGRMAVPLPRHAGPCTAAAGAPHPHVASTLPRALLMAVIHAPKPQDFEVFFRQRGGASRREQGWGAEPRGGYEEPHRRVAQAAHRDGSSARQCGHPATQGIALLAAAWSAVS